MSAILRPRILLPLRKILQLPSYGHSSHGRLSQAWLSLSKHAYSVRVQNNPESKCMDVTWEDGVTTNFPHLYLRDHCRCPSCFDPQTKSRVIFNSIYNSYLDSAAKDVNLSQDQQTIQVDWENDEQHPVSRFPVEWLRAHRFPTQDEISAMSRIYLKDRHTWGKELSGHIPEFDCQQLHQDDETLYRWLKCLTTVGLSIVKNVPREKGQVNKLINRVGYIRTTNYGPTFQVKSKSDASNAAFTSGGLGMHTDLTYFSYVPGIQFLHCINRAGQGGENQLVDAFKVAEDLRKNEPEIFDMLVKYPVRYFDIGQDYVDFYQLAQHPIIRLHPDGEIARICYSDHARSPMLTVPQDQVLNFYNAMNTFQKYVYGPDYMINVTLESGDMAVFDNYRIMHGRSPYTLSGNSIRHLEGGYVDWDEAGSRMRVLEEKLKINHFTGIA